MTLLDLGIPSTLTKAANLLLMWLGGLVGYAVHPLVWPIGPVCWLVYLTASAAQESGFEADIAGDDGASLGMLQFNAAGVGSIYPDEARTSPFWSGFYAARYVTAAILADARWTLVYVPVLGYAVMRYMWWGFGLGGSALTDALPRLLDGHAPRAVVSFVVWRVLTLPLSLVLGAALVATLPGWWRRVRRW